MKKLVYLIFFSSSLFYSCKKDPIIVDEPRKTEVLQGAITEDKTLNKNTDYLLKGQVYVKNNSTLTIPEGIEVVVEKADNPSDKGALIITKGSKLNIAGTQDFPVVFTSSAINKNPGDWIGIIILGKAPTNLINAHIKGLTESTDTEFGGTVSDDNSGSINFLRLEYTGGLNPNQEEEWEMDMASGLSLEGIGSATKVEHVMVKNSLDDGFQFVGGTVNGKYLISLNNQDDNFDFDRGYTGKLQFLISYHSASSTHSIRANGLESLNDKGATDAQPYTRPVISNMTIIGPDHDELSGNQSQGIYIRRNTRFNVRNSIIEGYSNGGLMMCPKTKPLLLNNLGSQFKYNMVNSDDRSRAFTYDNGPTGINIIPDPEVAALAVIMDDNLITRPALNKNVIIDNTQEIGFKSPGSSGIIDVSLSANSPALSGGDFSDPEFSTFFTIVQFKGASGTESWASSGNWAQWE
ncbi:hypothetical protein [Daejeonella oryzae]|uniref:hypothetical protein n=1 Tax=Daejeonella oryzae TaxID=1122943 RepID=UPI0004109967|nr:hypothetical protein [Daejeonella oryzae]